jgi:hypothetical protein
VFIYSNLPENIQKASAYMAAELPNSRGNPGSGRSDKLSARYMRCRAVESQQRQLIGRGCATSMQTFGKVDPILPVGIEGILDGGFILKVELADFQ